MVADGLTMCRLTQAAVLPGGFRMLYELFDFDGSVHLSPGERLALASSLVSETAPATGSAGKTSSSPHFSDDADQDRFSNDEPRLTDMMQVRGERLASQHTEHQDIIVDRSPSGSTVKFSVKPSRQPDRLGGKRPEVHGNSTAVL
jgi:hypothetical protein